VRDLIPAAATFVAEEFMRPQGVRVVPELECGDGADVVLHAWYPHWDLYALKVLRRAGRAPEIVRWLHRSEEVLQNLGYCPEYIEVFRVDENSAWRHHGSASNLNCVTGWYRAIREAVAGIEFDPGGMTHIPLALQVGRVVIERLQWRGGTWRVEVDDGGPAVEEMIVDGLPVEGCLKVPAPLVTPGAHRVVVRYGEGNRGVLLKELVNASVLRCSRKGRGLDVAFSGLGHVEGVFASDTPCTVRMDGEPVMSVWHGERSEGYFRVPGYGEHVLEIVPR
jgi:hypothetical protein